MIRLIVISSLILLVSTSVSLAQKATKATMKVENTEMAEMNFSEGKWKDIVALAQKNNKYIFVDAYATWCGPCKLLKSKTFKEKPVVDFYNKNFINVTIDMEKGEGEMLAEQWQIEAYPTLLFFSPEGKLVARELGFVEGKELVKIGKKALLKK